MLTGGDSPQIHVASGEPAAETDELHPPRNSNSVRYQQALIARGCFE